MVLLNTFGIDIGIPLGDGSFHCFVFVAFGVCVFFASPLLIVHSLGVHLRFALDCTVSTYRYGEGDPTDNAVEFHSWLQDAVEMPEGVKFAVFGLGDTQVCAPSHLQLQTTNQRQVPKSQWT